MVIAPAKVFIAACAVVALVPPFAIGNVPVTPVVNGKPVALLNTADDGVPSAGVTNVGLLDKTRFPVPVEVVAPEPPFATDKVPVTPVERGKPVAFVRVPEDGVPNAPPLTTKAPAEPTAVPSAVTTPVPVVVVDGATPAPPPITKAFAARAAEDAHVEALEK